MDKTRLKKAVIGQNAFGEGFRWTNRVWRRFPLNKIRLENVSVGKKHVWRMLALEKNTFGKCYRGTKHALRRIALDEARFEKVSVGQNTVGESYRWTQDNML